MGGRQGDHGNGAVAALGAGGGDADGGMRVDQLAAFLVNGLDGFLGFVVVEARPVEDRPRRLQRLVVDGEPLAFAEPGHDLGDAAAVAAHQVEQQALEIGRYLDVHRRTEGRVDLAPLHGPGLEEPRQYVVAVGPDHQLIDVEARLAGPVAGEDVAEIARRHGKGNRRFRRPDFGPGPEVIDGLGHDPGPIDGVDGAEAPPLAEGLVVEHRLHQVLAVVEGALNGDVVDVIRRNGGHLAALDVGNPSLGVEDEDLDGAAVAAGLDGGRAGIARGGADDGDPFAPGLQHVVEDGAKELHGHVLEGQRRPVEQLQQPFALADFLQRGDFRGVEIRIRAVDDPGERTVVDGAADERPDHAERQFRIGQAFERGDVGGGKSRPFLGHVKAAVGRHARQQNVVESEGRGVAPGRDVLHRPLLRLGRRLP